MENLPKWASEFLLRQHPTLCKVGAFDVFAPLHPNASTHKWRNEVTHLVCDNCGSEIKLCATYERKEKWVLYYRHPKVLCEKFRDTLWVDTYGSDNMGAPGIYTCSEVKRRVTMVKALQ